MIANKTRIQEIETSLIKIIDEADKCLKSQRYERLSELRQERNKLFIELQELTSIEYLETTWKVKIDKLGYYVKF